MFNRGSSEEEAVDGNERDGAASQEGTEGEEKKGGGELRAEDEAGDEKRRDGVEE